MIPSSISNFQPQDQPDTPDPAEGQAGRTFADRALWNAYAEGRADEREDFRTLLQQTQCVRDGWHPFTALALQAELLSALDDAAEFAEIDAADKRFPLK